MTLNGVVWNNITNKPLKPCDNGNGYLRVSLHKDGIKRKTYTKYIHRLLAESFIPNPNNYNEIDHIDNNKQNNNIDNLKWCSHKQNMNNEMTKLKWKGNHKKVQCYNSNHSYQFNDIKEASIFFKVAKSAISNCLSGRSKSSCGYFWEYIID